jgi:Malectin domain
MMRNKSDHSTSRSYFGTYDDMNNFDDVELDHDDALMENGVWSVDLPGKDPKQRIRSRCWRYLVGSTAFLAFSATLAALIVRLVRHQRSVRPATSFEIRINAGSYENFTDNSGNVWLADADEQSFLESQFQTFELSDIYDVCPATISGADSIGDGLYCSERWFEQDGKYEVFVPVTGYYEVVLYFAEIMFTMPGERVFDVLVEDQGVFQDFDITQVAGTGLAATRLTSTVGVQDGAATIQFSSKLDHAKISGISVLLVNG